MNVAEAALAENQALPRMIAIRAEREARRTAREIKRQHGGASKLQELSLVYVVICGPCAKIGHSTDVRKRISSLQVGSLYPLEIVSTRPGGRRVERLLHRRFAEHRISGEWFRLEGSLLEFVDAERAVNPTCKTMAENVKRAFEVSAHRNELM